jgi:hypothetical protein
MQALPGVEVDTVCSTSGSSRVHASCRPHEIQAIHQALNHILERFLQVTRVYMRERPVSRLVQISKSRRYQCSDVVKRSCRVEVSSMMNNENQMLGIMIPRGQTYPKSRSGSAFLSSISNPLTLSPLKLKTSRFSVLPLPMG